jgi:hypothetical protein
MIEMTEKTLSPYGGVIRSAVLGNGVRGVQEATA